MYTAWDCTFYFFLLYMQVHVWRTVLNHFCLKILLTVYIMILITNIRSWGYVSDVIVVCCVSQRLAMWWWILSTKPCFPVRWCPDCRHGNGPPTRTSRPSPTQKIYWRMKSLKSQTSFSLLSLKGDQVGHWGKSKVKTS